MKKPETQVKQDLIERLIPNLGKHLWPREMKIAKELLPQFDNLDFWAGLNLGYTLNSLAYFKTEKGWEKLTQEWTKFNFNPVEKEKVVLSDENFFLKGNVDTAEKKEDNQNLKEILKLW